MSGPSCSRSRRSWAGTVIRSKPPPPRRTDCGPCRKIRPPWSCSICNCRTRTACKCSIKSRREHPETQVIILTAHDSLNNAIESIKRGAYHFISKPYAPEELLSLIEKALEKQSLLRETEQLREKTQQLEKRLEIAETRLAPVFKSKAMQEIQELIEAMAPSEANVLITGESGVGKEVIANVIHSRSRRAAKPMVKLNCAAFPQAMIEGELFGYVKGAFTGATNDFAGMIAAAGGQHACFSTRFPRCRRICRRVSCGSCRNANTGRSAARAH